MPCRKSVYPTTSPSMYLNFMPLVAAQQKALLDHLFSNYRKELRPVKYESSGPTNVSIQFYFKQIQKIHESDQILTLYCWLEQYWKDEFLTWDPNQFNGLKELHVPVDMIWKPDLLV
uniref:Neur_chan_LBD domain-containing protein n=1 Tax=Panagrellus redivivus TaxID=6233 RepID=A0A7E4ZUU1_PANRE